jgi:hypothetical protein
MMEVSKERIVPFVFLGNRIIGALPLVLPGLRIRTDSSQSEATSKARAEPESVTSTQRSAKNVETPVE